MGQTFGLGGGGVKRGCAEGGILLHERGVFQHLADDRRALVGVVGDKVARLEADALHECAGLVEASKILRLHADDLDALLAADGDAGKTPAVRQREARAVLGDLFEQRFGRDLHGAVGDAEVLEHFFHGLVWDSHTEVALAGVRLKAEYLRRGDIEAFPDGEQEAPYKGSATVFQASVNSGFLRS